MSFFLKVSALIIIFSSINLAEARESGSVNFGQDPLFMVPVNMQMTETLPPESTPTSENLKAISLDDATKMVMQDTKNKVLAAKTEVMEGKKIHVIKIVTSKGLIQYIRIEAATGKVLEKTKK